METAAAEQHYEAAARARDGLDGARARGASEQSVVLDDHSNLDVVAVATDGGARRRRALRVRHGRVIGRTVHLIDRSMDESDAEILETVLPDLYPAGAEVPPVVLVAERRRRP